MPGMKDTFYFITKLTEFEHGIVEGILREELEAIGWELLYYRQFKTGHVPTYREAKTNAPRWVVLNICMDRYLDIVSGGFKYEKGVMVGESYDNGYEN